MKKRSRFFLVVILSAMTWQLQSCIQRGSSLEWIAVAENRFENESGEPMVFRGVNIRDPHDLANNGHWTKAHFQEAKDWGANIIRLPIHPWAWRERGEEAYLELVDQAVEWANELGLYLILDWHSIGNLMKEKFQHIDYSTTVEETSAFWNAVSARYADEPAVAMYEVFNEPTVSGEQFDTCTWDEWKVFNESMIEVIRSNHPRSVILVAGFNWAYDLTPVKDNPIDAPGIAYVSHPYPQKHEAPWEPQWEEDWGYVAETYPVILTEMGFALADEKGVHVPVEGDEVYGKTLDAFTSERGISWVVWCFDPDWSPYMFTDWNYTPTRQGTFYRKVLTGN